MAKRLAGPTGLILETDEFFYTQVGDDPKSYDWSDELLEDARAWNLGRFREALANRLSLIVVDRGNGLNAETREYAVHATNNGYQVQFAEPDSPWWLDLRVLLKYKQFVAEELFDIWAEKLAQASQQTHRVPRATIRDWMTHWRSDLTVEDLLQ